MLEILESSTEDLYLKHPFTEKDTARGHEVSSHSGCWRKYSGDVTVTKVLRSLFF